MQLNSFKERERERIKRRSIMECNGDGHLELNSIKKSHWKSHVS